MIRHDAIAGRYLLNKRQALAVGFVLENPILRLENLTELLPEVNRRTFQRDLQGLVAKGVLKSEGAARAIHYILRIKGL